MLSKIRIGTAQIIPGYGISSKKKLTTENFKKIFLTAKKNKILKIDTSELYSNSHAVIGKLAKKKMYIGTKIKLSKEITYEDTKKKVLSFYNQFYPAKLDYILIHNFKNSNFALIKKNLNFLEKIRTEHKYFKIGVSIYDENDFIKLKKIVKISKIEIVQLPINIFNQTFLQKKFVNFFSKKNIKIQARSIYLQGLLLMTMEEIRKKLKFKSYSLFKEWDKINNYSLKRKIDNCVQFLKKEKNVHEIIVGFNKLTELKDFLRAYQANKNILINIKKIRVKDENINLPIKWKYNNLNYD